jgi:hypothetical protein
MSRLRTPDTTLSVSVRPEPTRPKMPVTLPRIEREGCVADHAAHREVFDGQDLLAARAWRTLSGFVIDLVGQGSPDHCLNDLLAIEGRGNVGRNQPSIAQDRDPVGDLQRLLERMAK